MKADISRQMRAPDEPRQHIAQRVDDIHMVFGRPVAIFQLQPVDDVIAGELVHRRLREMARKNQITPLGTDRRQGSRFQPYQRHACGGDAIARFDETGHLRGNAWPHGLHALDHFPDAAREITLRLPGGRLAVLIGHADLAVLVEHDGGIEKLVVDRHVAIITGHPVEAIRSIDIFGRIIPGGVIVQGRA